MDTANKIEIKVFLRDENYKKESVKTALKVLPIAFGILFLYWLYSAFGIFKFLPKLPVSIYLLAVFVIIFISLVIAVLYAVGSGFEKADAIEKASKKTRIIFSEDGIDFVNGFDGNKKDWNEFTKIKETPDGFYIYPEKEKRFYIPGYAFQTREDINGFRAIVRLRLGGKAKLKL